MRRPALTFLRSPLGRWALAWALLVLVLLAGPALAKPRTHTVYAGQRLGSIAKRYNVSVEALCAANGISARSTIRPGQKLVIPDQNSPESLAPEPSDTGDRARPEVEKPRHTENSHPAATPGKPRLHVVEKGHTLSAISGRYGVTVSALCRANALKPTVSLTVGTRLLIPHKTDRDGSYARRLRVNGSLELEASDSGQSGGAAPSGGKSWARYVKPAWRRGYIKIRRYGRAWQGYVIDPAGKVLGHAGKKINFVMGTRENGPDIDPRLIRLIAQVSDKFGGRELRIVSGYRTKSFVAASKHKEGRAIDFSIPGIPNDALRDYLHTLANVGVGYYPNSSFVHLDVRGYGAYWVDYAGPGQAPKKSRHGKAQRGQPIESDDAPEDASHEHSHADGIEEAPSAPPPDRGEPAPAADEDTPPRADEDTPPPADEDTQDAEE